MNKKQKTLQILRNEVADYIKKNIQNIEGPVSVSLMISDKDGTASWQGGSTNGLFTNLLNGLSQLINESNPDEEQKNKIRGWIEEILNKE